MYLGAGFASVTPGARFRGRNRRGEFRWTRLNEEIVANGGRELVWKTVAAGLYPDSVQWRLQLTAEGSSTRVEEGYQILKIPRVMEWVLSVAMPAHRDRTKHLLEDLGRLKGLVEAASSGT
jgi:hypothetical protein